MLLVIRLMKHFSVLDHPVRHSDHRRPLALDLVLRHGNSLTTTLIGLQFPVCLNFRQNLGAGLGLRTHFSVSLQFRVTVQANIVLRV